MSQTDAVAAVRDRFATLGVKVYGAVVHGLDSPLPRAAYPYYQVPATVDPATMGAN